LIYQAHLFLLVRVQHVLQHVLVLRLAVRRVRTQALALGDDFGQRVADGGGAFGVFFVGRRRVTDFNASWVGSVV